MAAGEEGQAAGRVLILDDDEAVGQTIRFVAEGMGMTSMAVTSADSFFPAVESWRPSHIVLDLMMPKMDGVEVMRRLAQLKCRAGIIILSGVGCSILQAARRSAHDHGLRVHGVLPKPFQPSALRQYLGAVDAPPPREPSRPKGLPAGASLRETERLQTLRIGYAPRLRCANAEVNDFEVVLHRDNQSFQETGTASVLAEFEALGMLAAMRDFVTAKALQPLTESAAEDVFSLIMPVALSELSDSGLVERLSAQLHSASVDTSRVVLALCDTGTRLSEARVQQMATRLALKGFGLLASDVGSARMPLRWLARLPFTAVSVDAAMLPSDSAVSAETWLRWLLGLRDLCGGSITLTGVADARLRDRAVAVGFDFLQGDVVSAPLPAQALSRWMVANGTRT